MSTTEQKALAEPGMNSAAAFEEVRRLSAENEALRARERGLITALAECRDLFPMPEPGAELEFIWGQAMGDPESVPEYVKAQVDALRAQVEALTKPAYPPYETWSSNEGDSWRDSPDDFDFVDGLQVGDEYELLAGWIADRVKYRVTKAPDDTSDDYEVELVDDAATEPGFGHSDWSWPAKVIDLDADTPSPLTRPAVPVESSPEAAQAIQAMLAEYDFPSNPTNAARAGWRACRLLAAAPQPEAQPTEARCGYCDGTGHVHDQIGEWRGLCTCEAAHEAYKAAAMKLHTHKSDDVSDAARGQT